MPPLFVNNHTPPRRPEWVALAPGEPVDLNFVVPVPETIETDRIKLMPFIPSILTEAFVEGATQDPSIDQYLPMSLSSRYAVDGFCYTFILPNPEHILFAILDKTKDDALAGIIGNIYCSAVNLAVEIGPIVVLPAFRGTHVAKHSIGAILRHWLDSPSQGGMGFRRVVWTANPNNVPSLVIAERMGFKKEGLLRWTWVLPEGKNGKDTPPERGAGKGRDSVIFSICWDEWERGVRDEVHKRLEA